jgi:hypothetical protein
MDMILRNVLMIAVSTLLVITGVGAQQSTEGTGNERLVKVVTLDTPQVNNEFTRNVKIMQERRNAIAHLYTLLEQESDENKKYTIEAEIQELMQGISKDNQLMVKTYLYSLNRKYVRSIENATIFIELTDAEVADYREEYAQKGMVAPKSLKSNMISVCTLNSAKAAQAFQNDVAKIQSQRDLAIQLQVDLDATVTPEDRAYAQGRLDQVVSQLSALNQAMYTAYGFTVTRDYVMQIDKSSLYIWATDSEVADASVN